MTEPATKLQPLSNRAVDQALQRLNSLATLPHVAIEITKLVDDVKTEAGDFQRVIETDPVLVAKVLKVVNSAFYGMPRRIDSIKEAVVLLGPAAVNRIAITGTFDKLFRERHRQAGFDPRALWDHSLAVATASMCIAEEAGGTPPDRAFLAGLVHDLGVIAEHQVCRSGFEQVVEFQSRDRSDTFREAERDILGATHEDFGAALCKKWSFPSSLEAVTGYHHRPFDAAEEHRQVTALVHVADILAARLGVGFTLTVETDTVGDGLLDFLGLSSSDLAEVQRKLPQRIEQSKELFANAG